MQLEAMEQKEKNNYLKLMYGSTWVLLKPKQKNRL
jgi:hypothetical protein